MLEVSVFSILSKSFGAGLLVSAGLLVASVNTFAHGYNLLDAYNDSWQGSPSLKSQQFTALASSVDADSARAALFPVVNLDASVARKIQSDSLRSTESNIGVNLEQPVFNFASLQAWRAGVWSSRHALSNYAYQQQTFIINVANDYFALLQAEEVLSYKKATQKNYKLVLSQTKDKMQAGLATDDDVKQALSKYDTSVADTIKAQNDLKVAQVALALYTGKRVLHVDGLSSKFKFSNPTGDIQKWVDLAVKSNKNLIAQQQLSKSTSYTMYGSFSTYLPNVTLDLDYDYTRYNQLSSAYLAANGNKPVHNKSIKLSFNWSILNGGAGFATIRKNAALYGAQQAASAYASRDVIRSTRQHYLAVVSAVSQVKAYQQAIVSSQESFDQAFAKYQAGIGTIVDILEKIKLLSQNRLLFAQQKYAYISAQLALAQDAGFLGKSDIISLNSWLV